MVKLSSFLLLLIFVGCQEEPERRVPPWPEWSLHHWVWEDESTQASALDLVDGYLERQVPVGAVIIDSPWATGYNTFDWDPGLFPDAQAMVDAFHERDVRVLVWIVPAINLDEADLYAEAAERGFFMQKNATSGPAVVDWWKGKGSLIDYFNAEAVAWWHAKMDKTLALGIDGWKCDGLDFSAILTPYSPGLGRNVDRIEYSHAYYRDFFEYTRKELGPDRIITARPVDNYGADLGGEVVSFAPIDINWAGWVGDQDPDFSGLAAALNNMYYSAEMGYVNFGSDIGGYRTDDSELGRDKVTFIRWAQLGAFNPVMENGGAGEHRPWMFDAETLEIYRQFTNLHYALLPYLMKEGATAYSEGRSLMRFLDKQRFSYLLGPDVFIAPMLSSEPSITVTFPEEGRWVYLFNGEVFTNGSTVEIDVPLESYPVFYREGSTVASSLLMGFAE